ncbi:MAG: ABC transporter substrate-binding protein [Actinobacteria bacterium]|nr:ABC transporter substrate-binding protein [Actinomycetota bacterium]
MPSNDVSEKGSKQISRREFLKLAGMAGGAAGLGVGFGSLAVACGGEETTTTTVASTTTTAALTTSTTLGLTTTVSTQPEAGRTIKLGYVLPITGPLAPYGTGVDLMTQLFTDAIGDGVVLADSKKHPFELLIRDAQSDSNRAAQVTGDLIQNDKVDLVISVGAPDMVNPSADTAEALECPSLSSFSEWHAFTLGRKAPPEGFKWTYIFGWASDGNAVAFIGALKQIPSNNKLGLIFANDADGMSWMQFAPTVFGQVGGFQVVTTDLYPPGAEDYTAQISKFKKEGCELLAGGMLTPDFTNFWKQCRQQSFQPKIVCISKALIFPAAVAALGNIGYNLCGEGGWGPWSKFTEPLTGLDSKGLCDKYEAATGQMWDETAAQIFLLGWAVDVFKRAANADDKGTVVSAMKATNLTSLYGPMDFSAPVADQTYHPHPNVVTIPCAVAQWVKGTGKWPVDKVLVYSLDERVFQAAAAVQPIQYG